MKRVDLIQWMQQYDANKGLRRKANQSIPFLSYLPLIGSAEPSVITLIKKFISDNENADELSDFHLFQLAKILAITPTEQGTESEKITTEIANTFGGIELLKKIEEQNALSVNTVYLLIHDPSPKELLCEELIKLHSNMKNNPLLDYIMDCFRVQKAPFGVYLYIELFSIISSIHLINMESNAKLSDLLQKLMTIQIWNLTAIKKIINHLLKNNPSLLNYENLLNILNYNTPEKLALIIDNLLIDQEQFNFLVLNQDALNSCNRFNKICRIFTENKWDINPFFNLIVTESNHENKIFYAINRLDELKITQEFITKILQAITAVPANSTQLIEAIASLGPKHISSMELDLFIANIERADQIAEMITELKNNDLYSYSIQSMLSQAPKEATKIGEIIMTLHQMRCLTHSLIDSIGYYPQCIAHYIRFKQMNTTIEINPDPGQMKALLCILALLDKAQLLTNKNVDFLFKTLKGNLNLLPDFLIAIYSLIQSNALNQIKFDTIIANSEHINNILTFLDIPLQSIPSVGFCTKTQDYPEPIPNTIGFFQPSSSSAESSRVAWLQIQKQASFNSC